MRSSYGGIDILGLARKAKAKGYDAPEQIIPRIEAMICRQRDYVERRECQGIIKPIDKRIKEDNEILAMVIVLMESLENLGTGGE